MAPENRLSVTHSGSICTSSCPLNSGAQCQIAVAIVWETLSSRACHIGWFCPIHIAFFWKKPKYFKTSIAHLPGQCYHCMKEVRGDAQVLQCLFQAATLKAWICRANLTMKCKWLTLIFFSHHAVESYIQRTVLVLNRSLGRAFQGRAHNATKKSNAEEKQHRGENLCMHYCMMWYASVASMLHHN